MTLFHKICITVIHPSVKTQDGMGGSEIRPYMNYLQSLLLSSHPSALLSLCLSLSSLFLRKSTYFARSLTRYLVSVSSESATPASYTFIEEDVLTVIASPRLIGSKERR